MGLNARVYLSLGSNISPHKYLRSALAVLRDLFGEVLVSPVYESRAVGFEGDNFLNLVVGVDVELPVAELSERLRAIEADHGRQRQSEKFSPRTLDIDILTYGDLVGDFGGVRLPRDEIHRYQHVIRPLADLAPDVLDPLTGRSFASICESLPADDSDLWQVDMDWRPG